MFSYKFISGLALLCLAGMLLTACGGDTPGATATAGATAGSSPSPAATSAPNISTATPVQKATQTAASIPTATPAVREEAPFLPPEVPLISPNMKEARQFTAKWKVQLEEVASSEVIGESGDLVFVKARSGALYALNKADGAIVWKHAAPPQAGTGSPIEPFAYVTSEVTVVGDVAAETLIGYETRTGQLKWTHNLKFDAPRRDIGNRFIGGRVYSNTVVVAVSSKQDPLNPQRQTINPEYVLLAGVDLTSGQPVWSYISTPSDNDQIYRPASVLFSSKMIVIEEPNFSVSAFEGANGYRRWLAPSMFILRTGNLDALYSGNPGGDTQHDINIRKHDIETGKILWEKILPIQVINDPLVDISPDDSFIYLEAKVNGQDTALVTINLSSNVMVWNFKTTTLGNYTLNATNDGVRLRNYGAKSGVIYFDKNQPAPLWFIGGIEFGEETAQKEGLYITGRQLVTNNQYNIALFLVDLKDGQIKFADKLNDLPSASVYAGQDTIYLPTLNQTGKIVIYAYKRP